MKAGILTEKIVVQRPNVTRDEYNSETTTYVDHITTKAFVDHNRGNRIEVTDENFWTDIRTFVVRIYHDIQPTDRISYNNNIYRILDIDIDKELQRMVIKTEKVNE